MTYPILYSLRNCPFAMRARIAIFKSQQKVILRDVVLSNKPAEMLIASPKGTVPILVFPQAIPQPKVIEESLDIMLWALNKSDPDDLLDGANPHALMEILALVALFDHEFKACLEQYRCAKRYHEDTIVADRYACEFYLTQLEQRLCQHDFLMSNKESLADLALLPFIRQFARVERQWYLQSPYPKLRQWLNRYLQSAMFTKVMAKHPLWLDSQQTIYFGGR